MNHNIGKIILVFALLLGVVAPSWAATGGCEESSVAIIQVFQVGIRLNQRFKKSVGESNHEEYLRLRTKTENYTKDKLLPCMRSAAHILGRKNDPPLEKAILRVAISFSNSANEEIPNILGEIFGNNPDAIINTIHGLPMPERKVAIGLLKFGWANVEKEFPHNVAVDRRKILRQINK